MSATPGKQPNLRLSALVLLLIIGGLIAITLSAFFGGFSFPKKITLVTDRAGLVMEPKAKVKMRGVQVGTVRTIKQRGDHAVLELDIDRGQMKHIPADVRADIQSSTVFGAKYVDLDVPAGTPTDAPIQAIKAGAEITSENVTVEFNTLFEKLDEVLNVVQPEKINAALGAVSTALDGQGTELGEVLAGGGAYLREVNQVLPEFQYDLQQLATVSGVYADVSPDLMRLLDNATAVGGTVVDSQDDLRATLRAGIETGQAGYGATAPAADDFIDAVGTLAPTIALTDEYSEVLTCFIVGVANAKDTGEAAFGGGQPGLNLSSTFLPGAPAYSYPENLPKVNAKNAPSCYGLPWRDESTNAPYVVTDSGVNPMFTGEMQMADTSLWAFLIGPPPPGFSW